MMWRLAFERAMEQGSIAGLVDVLQAQATSHAGTAPAKIKNAAVKLLRTLDNDAVYPLTVGLCGSNDPTAQEVGCIVLADYYETDTREVIHRLRDLADSPHWEVREWVASACGAVLRRHFGSFYPMMMEWARDESENVRRAVVLAVMYAGKSRDPAFADPILDVLELLLSDKSRYVRDNLGPFAIGSALIRYYPEKVLGRLDQWIEGDDEQVRWNIAMIFSTAAGASLAAKAENVLRVLSTDDRTYVKKAVSKAMKNIGKRTSQGSMPGICNH